MNAGGPRQVSMPAMAEIDRVIFGPDPFQLSEGEQANLRLKLIREAVEYHLHHCAPFRAYAARLHFSIDDVQCGDDLERIPQLPTGLFKRVVVSSGIDKAVCRPCTSSGTQGRLSVVWRDRCTIQRLLGSIQTAIAGLIDDPPEKDVLVVNLGPNQAEAGDLWFAYVMSLIELAYITRHMVVDGRFDPSEAVVAIERAKREAKVVVVTGPPVLLRQVSEAALRTKRVTTSNSEFTVVTAGGWKRPDGSGLDRQALTELVASAFRLQTSGRIRDAFNQVELNTVIFECSSGAKHVPPWVHVCTRDIRTLTPQPNDHIGLLSYLDASALSYPAFLISDDVGRVKEGRCACGRYGPTIEIQRRIERAEHWGCALKMNAFLEPDMPEIWGP
jgi:long-chain-fatty-acid---luciferin-component ligase